VIIKMMMSSTYIPSLQSVVSMTTPLADISSCTCRLGNSMSMMWTFQILVGIDLSCNSNATSDVIG